MTRRLLVVIMAVVALLGVGVAAFLYNGAAEKQNANAPVLDESALVRARSPVLGPESAPVTIVEFFDPACGACREIHPTVKRILAAFPDQVRVVLRYAAFNEGSDEVIRILETARLQGVFDWVLEELLETQSSWVTPGGPDLAKAWEAAHAAGLDVREAREKAMMPEITAVLTQDMVDVRAVGITQVPTFFVNGKPLPSFGAQQLYELVEREVGAIPGSPNR